MPKRITKNVCPIHFLIGKQSISIEEMEFFVSRREELNICESCTFRMSQKIKSRITEDIGKRKRSPLHPDGFIHE